MAELAWKKKMNHATNTNPKTGVRERFLHMALHRAVSLFICAAVVIAPIQQARSQQSQVAADAAQDFSDEQLDALLAPIALYPDQLLTQILMASVYPLEVVSAARWAEAPANKTLTGSALDNALAQQSWDPSVKSLVPFPQILQMMNEKLDWVQQLGYAVTNQEGAVMDSVQRLRAQAQAAGNLKTTEQQVVSSQGQIIIITPAQPSVVYVPMYNPTLVYGRWLYPAYPPVYFPPPPGYYVGPAIVAGLAFGVGVAISANYWGWANPNWSSRNVYVNVNRYNTINVNRPPINNPAWRPRPPVNGQGGGYRPPPGPVGPPGQRPGMGQGQAPGQSRPAAGQGGKPPGPIGRPPGGQTGQLPKPVSKPSGQIGGRPGSGGNQAGGLTGKPPGQNGGPLGQSYNKPPTQSGMPSGGQAGRPAGQIGRQLNQNGAPQGSQINRPSSNPGMPTAGQGGRPSGPTGKVPLNSISRKSN
jgi:hypothetical protein